MVLSPLQEMKKAGPGRRNSEPESAECSGKSYKVVNDNCTELAVAEKDALPEEATKRSKLSGLSRSLTFRTKKKKQVSEENPPKKSGWSFDFKFKKRFNLTGRSKRQPQHQDNGNESIERHDHSAQSEPDKCVCPIHGRTSRPLRIDTLLRSTDDQYQSSDDESPVGSPVGARKRYRIRQKRKLLARDFIDRSKCLRDDYNSESEDGVFSESLHMLGNNNDRASVDNISMVQNDDQSALSSLPVNRLSNSFLSFLDFVPPPSHALQRQQIGVFNQSNENISSLTPPISGSGSIDTHILVPLFQRQCTFGSQVTEIVSASGPVSTSSVSSDGESVATYIPRTVHTQVDFIHCLVPDLLRITDCTFYWGVMDRYEAEKLLENKPEGTFLLRDSAQEDFLFSVSFRRYSRSLHARIEQLNHRFSFDSHDPGVFSSENVCDLIEHYKDPSCCMFFEPMLTLPLHRSFTFSLQHLCRSVISRTTTYDGVNYLPLPRSLKEYLKYYHYKHKVRVRTFEVQL